MTSFTLQTTPLIIDYFHLMFEASTLIIPLSFVSFKLKRPIEKTIRVKAGYHA